MINREAQSTLASRLATQGNHRTIALRLTARAVAVALLGSSTWLSSATARAETVTQTRAQAQSPATAEPATGGEVEIARSHFVRGVEFYNNGDYKLSLEEFRRSYELSQNYRILYNIGQVHQQLSNYTKALTALERFLKEGGADIPEERQKEVTANVTELRKKVAHVVLVVNVKSPEILIDGFPSAERDEEQRVMVDPGDHRVELRKAGYQNTSTVVTLAAGDTTELRLSLSKVKSVFAETGDNKGLKNQHSFPWAGWITTGALAVGAGVTGILAANQASNLADLRNSPDSTATERDDVSKRARTFALASDILTASAVVAGGVSLYLTLSSTPSSKEHPPAPSTRLGLNRTGISLVRSF